MALALIKLPAHPGYLILFALAGAESTGVPVPGETALITAGVLAHRDQFSAVLLLAAFVAWRHLHREPAVEQTP